MDTKPLASALREFNAKITASEYDKLMQELVAMRKIMGNYQMDMKLRDAVERMAEEYVEIKKEQRFIRRVLIKIGTALFNKAAG